MLCSTPYACYWRGFIVAIACALSLGAWRSAAGADAPTNPAGEPSRLAALAAYSNLFGDDEKKLAQKHSAHDEAAFANTLIQRAKDAADDKLLLGVIYEKAAGYGVKDPVGYASAATAARELSQLEPERKQEWDAKVAEVRLLEFHHSTGAERNQAGAAILDEAIEQSKSLCKSHQYTEATRRLNEAAGVAATIHSPRSTEITQALQNVQTMVQLNGKITRLQAQLTAKPDDKALAMQLVEMELLEADDPAEASRYAAQTGDAELPQMLQLAAKPAKDLEEQELLDLANWYFHMGSKLTGPRKNAALARAMTYADTYLDKHPAKDGNRLIATKIHDDASGALDVMADHIVLINCHNSTGNDRGATKVYVSLIDKGTTIWKSEKLDMPWSAGVDGKLAVAIPLGRRFNAVHVDVVEWTKHGAGLTEIQVMRGSKNIALGARATVSAAFDERFSGARLTDGIVTSEKLAVGYWIAPDNQAAWAEVSLTESAGK